MVLKLFFFFFFFFFFFWKTIKPYLSKKKYSSDSKIILSENSNLVIDQKEVSEIFNEFIINVVDEIGKAVSFDSKTHPSICKTKEYSRDIYFFLSFFHV